MQNRFYIKSKKGKLTIQFFLGAGALFITSLSVYIAWILEVYFIIPFILFIILSVIAPFFDVPSMVARGNLKYYALLFLAEKKNGVLIIHGGTLFDYVFVINRKMSVKPRTHFILRQYLTGLLNLIDECTENEDPQLIIRGTSYIMNRKTISKMGFKIIETDFIERMIILFNYINILLSYSIAKGKLSFPKIISQTITFEATLEELINKKSYILELNKKLQKFS